MTHDSKNQSEKIDSYENLNHGDMQEILLLKCENSIRADEIVNLLNSHYIVARQHDETQYLITGTSGPVSGIAIYVFERDYEKALSIIHPALEERNNVKPFCPKCGSEEVSPIIRRHDYGTFIGLLCIFLLLIPSIYLGFADQLDIKSSALDYIALAMAIAAFILMFAGKHANANYKCKECGRKFNYR